ncbi:hypothetical protein N7510_001465 [Penicillium lagena]|uniref:uncharacterized protein n=1 Tax=Penicillium lagena TaxID=94218 RepID=UPI00254160B1|nr:uncharacterized protein N7510_001465 [Penicillium lagena]KAJ5625156.1 hypothetical protein N7510_001465 [Penicillium lagena]
MSFLHTCCTAYTFARCRDIKVHPTAAEGVMETHIYIIAERGRLASSPCKSRPTPANHITLFAIASLPIPHFKPCEASTKDADLTVLWLAAPSPNFLISPSSASFSL